MRWSRKGIWEKGVKQVNTDVSWLTRQRCVWNGHLWSVQQFDISTHRMLMICNRCGNTYSTTMPKVKMVPNEPPQAEEH